MALLYVETRSFADDDEILVKYHCVQYVHVLYIVRYRMSLGTACNCEGL